ncbi:PPPDE putative peptidase domain-containing protein [Phyllosticta citriasiana]|uniref:PPPDE putative peptidase domain-containing protein n=1 Tax=Phyllosticta citriasiana TaxID=595635 RepID=A0ABR1KDB6_9PEZI
MSQSKPKSSRKSGASHRSTLSVQKTEIKINVYDLLPPGKVSSVLWTLGSGLLHSGVVIKDKEYAYGGHDRRGMTGVYWTRPRVEPPGGTFRCEVLQGFSFLSEEELTAVIKDASEKFQGAAYNLLTFNCNHFTSYLCEALTAKPAPRWLNRAAAIGVALPCVVPREWIAPPDHDTADGELLDEDEHDERAAMLRRSQSSSCRSSTLHLATSKSQEHQGYYTDRETSQDRSRTSSSTPGGRRSLTSGPWTGSERMLANGRDTSGRQMPPSEMAPVPTKGQVL